MMTESELVEATLLHYSRRLWKNPRTRQRLLYMWEHPEHPQREQFEKNRKLVEGLMECADPQEYASSLGDSEKWSLRALSREIPSNVWKLWDESKEK